MTDQVTRKKLDRLTAQEEKILKLLREERQIAKNKFPLAFALVATFGAAATLSGINKIIEKVDYLQNNPIILILVGLAILVTTGAAYKKLG